MGTIADYEVFVTYINPFAILRLESCWPFFRVTSLEEGEPTTRSIQ